MIQHPLKDIIIRGINEIEEQLQLYGFSDDLFDNEIMFNKLMESFVFDKDNSCIWSWNIEEYIDCAIEYGLVTEQEREDFLLAYLLKV